MLRDLAKRLRQRGLGVELGYGGDIALVASHGRVAVAVETDAVLSRGTLRESLRLRPAALRRLGWHYVRVHTFELFADPEAVAARIAGIAGLSSAVTMEVETLDASSQVDASTSSAHRPVETRAPLSATEAIDAAIDSVTPIGAAPSYVARFADEEPPAAPAAAFPAGHSEDDVLTAPLDVPQVNVPQVNVPELDIPQLDVAESAAPRQDAPPYRPSADIPRADALDDE
jgi:hypothetical protein